MPGTQDPILTEPIVNRYQRKPFWKKWPVWFVLLVLAVVAWIAIRVALMPYPAFAARVRDAGDGWRVLRGAFHLPVPEPRPDGWFPRACKRAFQADLDFIVFTQSGKATLRSEAADSPIAVLVMQAVETPVGLLACGGVDRRLVEDELAADNRFERLERFGGWAVAVSPEEESRPWRGWAEEGLDGLEVLDVETQAGTGWTGVAAWLGGLFGSGARWSELELRPGSMLARWDDYNRRAGARVAGYCGLGALGDEAIEALDSVVTHVLVRDGLGPYGPRDVERALRAGHHYCGLPHLGETSPFRFLAVERGKESSLAVMGDSVKIDPGRPLELKAVLHIEPGPENLVMHLFLDGVEIARQAGPRLAHEIDRAGAYRVEVGVETDALPLGRQERIFIFSNPIYVLAEKPAGAG
ncbi:MAG: hypothetical protein JXR96_03910 [Deltaproteobacteria bacterium]|nr:hypothetical protein [Deltaproteobacteria bacterium]